MRYRRRFAVFDVQSTVRSSDETPSFLPSQPTAGFERDWPRYTAFIKNQQVAFRRISLPLFSVMNPFNLMFSPVEKRLLDAHNGNVYSLDINHKAKSLPLSPSATTLHMARANVKRRHSDLPHFESVARISSLPIVESGIHIAGNVYRKIKRSNSLMNWSLDTAEQSLAIATATARPAIFALNGPITTIDQLLCKGIDIVEQRVPAVHLPPHVIYLNTREYVNKKIVKPVLMRAGSVKQIGSQAANAAADRLDGALTVADKYVDRYLPGDPTDKEEANPVESVSKTTRTIKHGARFSRKLQKRLTRRTLVEARALKQQGTECIHVLLYIVELIATDPKLALQKAKELWNSLSLPEPENQARPDTLEQLLVLLTRESARCIVHLVNGTAALAAKTPRRLSHLFIRLSHQLLAVVDASLQLTLLIGKNNVIKEQISVIRSGIERLSSTTNQILEKFAAFLAGRPSHQKVPHMRNREQNHNNHMSATSNPPINGIE